MTLSRSARWGGALGLTGVVLGAIPAAAQGPIREARWSLSDLQVGLCVQFLVSPSSAELLLRGAGTPTPVESVAEAYPALARVAAAEATYHGWVPSEYCWFGYGGGVAKGRPVDNDHGRQLVAVGFLSLRASDLPDSADSFAPLFFTSASALDHTAAEARVRVDKFRFLRSNNVEEGVDSTLVRYEARHGSTVIMWEGKPGAPRAVDGRTIHLAGFDINGGRQSVRATFTPDSSFAPSGNLRVDPGTQIGDLLAASPIRLVTSFSRGGGTEWVVSR